MYMENIISNKLFEDSKLFLCDADGKLRPIGNIVEHSTSLESKEVTNHIPTMNSLSFSCEIPHLAKWYEKNANLKPLQNAQVMLDRLRELHALWHKYYGFGMRKERRKIEQNFKALAQRFVNHCRLHNIMIKK